MFDESVALASLLASTITFIFALIAFIGNRRLSRELELTRDLLGKTKLVALGALNKARTLEDLLTEDESDIGEADGDDESQAEPSEAY